MNLNTDQILYADLDLTEGVVLNLKNKRYYRLNETSQILWKAFQDGKSEEEAAQEITETYDVSLEEAKKDTQQFIQKLHTEGIVEENTNSSSPSLEEARASKTKGFANK